MKHPVIIIDLDGTLCENLFAMHEDNLVSHAEKMEKYHWARPFPLAQGVLSRLKAEHSRCKIIILTGRSEPYRPITEDWLDRHNLPYDKLVMMPFNWTTFAEYTDFKRTKIRTFRPILVIDDSLRFLNLIDDLAPTYLINYEAAWNYADILKKLTQIGGV